MPASAAAMMALAALKDTCVSINGTGARFNISAIHSSGFSALCLIFKSGLLKRSGWTPPALHQSMESIVSGTGFGFCTSNTDLLPVGEFCSAPSQLVLTSQARVASDLHRSMGSIFTHTSSIASARRRPATFKSAAAITLGVSPARERAGCQNDPPLLR